MDRLGLTVIIVCLVLLFGLEALFDQLYPPIPPKPKPHAAAISAPATNAPAAASADGNSATAATTTPPTEPKPLPSIAAAVPAKLTLLENNAIKVTLTSDGAAISEILLKQHKEDSNDNVVLNQKSASNVMALSGWTGGEHPIFTVQENLPGSVSYSTELPGGVKWQRTYTLGADYALSVKDSLTNPGTASVHLPGYSLSVGRAEPLLVEGHYQRNANMYLGSGWLTNNKFHLTTQSDFDSSSFLWVVKTRDPRVRFSSKEQDEAPLRWLGVENQFFTVLLTPLANRTIDHAEFECLNTRDVDGNIPSTAEPDIEAAAYFPELEIPADKTVSLDYSLYAGPKDYTTLNALGDDQGEIMNYGWFVILISPMLAILRFWYNNVHNYGLAIILLTLMVKTITWPLQSFTNRSGKRMQALAPKLKELQAKYKDQPEKLNTETFGLYREYGVNPFAGCLPALVQMPVFFSLYYMLQNAVELRGQQFLWIHDLTKPDTVAMLNLLGYHIALNPLPLMVTGLTMVMMRLTPQIGDPAQAKVAQLMPLFFLFIFYNFAAALSLYYVINNCVSIVQIYRNLKKPLPELKRVPKKGGPGRS